MQIMTCSSRNLLPNLFLHLYISHLCQIKPFQQTFSGYQLCKHIQQINSEGQFIWVETPFQQLEQVAFVQYKMNKSYKADVYTMGLQKVSRKHKSHASVSGVLVWYKEELQKRERERERERDQWFKQYYQLPNSHRFIIDNSKLLHHRGII